MQAANGGKLVEASAVAAGTVELELNDLGELCEVASSGGISLQLDHPHPASDGVPVEARADAEARVPKNDVADGVPVMAEAAGGGGGEEAEAREDGNVDAIAASPLPDEEAPVSTSRSVDEKLLEAWRLGDLAAGERLWRRHAAAIQRFFRNKVPWAVANDLTQRSVEACLRARDHIQSFRAYLLGVATRQLFDYIRSERRKRQRDADLETLAIDEAMPSPEEWVGTKREKRILLRALRRIPVVYQVVIELYYWEQLTQNEIAQVLGWPPGTVRTRISAARRLVRGQIESLCRGHEERLSTIDSFEQWAARTHHAVPSMVSSIVPAKRGEPSGSIDRDEVPPDEDLLDEPVHRVARGSMQFATVAAGTVDETIDEAADVSADVSADVTVDEALDEAGEGEGANGAGVDGNGERRPPRRR